jgi:hypothetical protein
MEALGGVASVVSLAAVVAQLLKPTKELHEFWTSVKEIPTSLQWLSADLDVLREVLKAVQQDATQCSDIDSNYHLSEILQRCMLYIRNLHDAVRPFQSESAGMSRQKTWRSIKAV